MPPTLLVHGIWDDARKLGTLRDGLLARGVPEVMAISLSPNDGRASIAALARRVEAAAAELAPNGDRIDLVGFSMGALVSRYFVQRLSGKARVRRFVSIAGPHAGTYAAMAVPRALARYEGIHEMRPGSPLLTELDADPDPFGPVEVHVIYTPYDLMIVPATSSRLRHAKSEQRVPVAMHRFLITDPRAIDAVHRVLSAPDGP